MNRFLYSNIVCIFLLTFHPSCIFSAFGGHNTKNESTYRDIVETRARGVLDCNTLSSTQYDALESFYYATNGLSWCLNETHSSSGVAWTVPSVRTEAPCTDGWYGVTCGCDSPNYYIESLALSSTCLHGTIPSDIRLLPRLHSIDLSFNRLYSSMPPELGDLSLLVGISLQKNEFSGNITSSLGNLNILQSLVLDDNNLSGSIPDELWNLLSVEELTMSMNSLTGTVSSSIGDMNQLIVVDLHDNSLQGTIPDTMANLTRLQLLDFSSNNFHGSIPAALGNLTSLEVLSFNDNRLQGPIPTSITQLLLLNHLALFSNSLTGTIPKSIGDIILLEYIDVSDNLLHGSISESICRLSRLTELSFDTNQLTGPIPHCIGDLINLQLLYLDTNALDSSIPSSVGNLTALQYLFLFDNFLTGEIPKTFCELISLAQVDLDSNLLQGPIPDDIGAMSSLTSLNLYGNQLDGRIPESIGNISSLYSLVLYSNHLTGSIPSTLGNCKRLVYISLQYNLLSQSIPARIFSIDSLDQLILNNNLLTGRFYDIFLSNDISYSLLSIINVASNILSGSLSCDFSIFKNLVSLSSSSNCFVGTIPESLCELSSATTIIFGVSGGNPLCSSNRKVDDSRPSFVRGTFSVLGLRGTIPSCLFAMRSLQTLHFSGNKLHGTVPDLVVSNITNLLLANNALTGEIPKSLQSHSFIEFDVSSNRLRGTLIDDFRLSMNQTTLGLAVNRLSGPLPSTLQNDAVSQYPSLSLNILANNIFSCENYQIPKNDPNSHSYTCGSFELVLAASIWSVLASLCIVTAVTVIVYYSARTDQKILSRMSARIHQILIKSKLWHDIALRCQLGLIKELTEKNSQSLHETKAFLVTASMLLHWNTAILSCSVVILIPLYATLNTSSGYSMVSYSYGYVVSIAYIHGVFITIFLGVSVCLVLCILLILLTRLQRLFIVDQSQDQGNDMAEETAYTMKESILQYRATAIKAVSDVQRKLFTKEFSLYSIIFLMSHGVNIIMTLSINYVYVNALLGDQSVSRIHLLFLEVAIGSFKVFWSFTYIPSVAKALQKYFTPSFCNKNRMIMHVTNVIIAPCLTTFIVNQSCLYYVFKASNEITYTATVSQCQQFDISPMSGPSCVLMRTYPLLIYSYPTFQYSYACGTALLVSYTPVLLYTYIIYGFVFPILRSVPIFRDQSSQTLQSIAQILKIDMNLNRVNGCNIVMLNIVHSTVMLTFGLASPILGITVAVGIINNLILSRICCGKIINSYIQTRTISASQTVNNPMADISESEQMDASQLAKQIETNDGNISILEQIDMKESWRIIFSVFPVLVLTVSVFWAFLFFDMVSDLYSYETGTTTSVAFGLTIPAIILVLSLASETKYISRHPLMTRLDGHLMQLYGFKGKSANRSENFISKPSFGVQSDVNILSKDSVHQISSIMIDDDSEL